jgi:integral membrane protein
MARSFLFYRVMAFVVGTLLILSILAAVFFQVLGHQPFVIRVVWTAHGYIYVVYLVAAGNLALRAHWGLGRILLVVCAGFVPFLAFIIEHRVNVQFQQEQAAEQAAELAAGQAAGQAAAPADGAGPVRPGGTTAPG